MLLILAPQCSDRSIRINFARNKKAKRALPY